MHESTIQVKIQLDEQKIPQSIDWSATDSTAQEAQAARAMMLTFWDPTDKTALRIDLWTKDMMVDEMADFFYQNLKLSLVIYLWKVVLLYLRNLNKK